MFYIDPLLAGYDPARAGQGLAALAGVLAAIAIAVLAIPRATGRGAAESPARFGLPLLFFALFTLIVSAVVWAGLSGNPPQADIYEELARCRSQCRSTESFVEALVSLRWHRAAGAVGLLALGALALLAGIGQIAQESYRSTTLTPVIGGGFAVLAGLAANQVVIFTVVAAALSENGGTVWPEVRDLDLWMGGAVVLLSPFLLIVWTQARGKSHQPERNWARLERLGAWTLILSVVTAILMLTSYATSPFIGPTGGTTVDRNAWQGALSVAGGVLFCATVLTMAWYVYGNSPVGPARATESGSPGEVRQSPDRGEATRRTQAASRASNQRRFMTGFVAGLLVAAAITARRRHSP